MKYILLPLIAGLIGWFTNYIAVLMLFRPRYPVKFLGLSFQGIFPKRQKYLAEQLGNLVADELLSSGDIKERLLGGSNLDDIIGLIEYKIDDYLLNTFPEKYPITSIFFGAKRKAQIKADLLEEVHTAVPALISDYADKIDSRIDIKDMVREKVEALDPLMLEKLLNSILKKEFRFIEIIGAVLGVLIGIIQVLISILL
ncbi:MAG: DUF445 family protein [Flavobacteriales bacterium]|nr:DUF445 family protein [Flavobacteriales bacterium]